MIKLRLAIVLVLALMIASCRAPAEKLAVDRLESQQEKLFTKYTAYVNADPKFSDPKVKDDEMKFLQSIRDIVSSLKKSMGE